MTNILIYNGRGTSFTSIRKLEKSLKIAIEKNVLSSNTLLKRVNKKNLAEELLKNESKLFIMPGGQDRYYHSALKGSLNNAIKEFVKKGNGYFGLCGGAYYACKNFDFDKGGKNEILGQRELCFFPGKAVGPAFNKETFSYFLGGGNEIVSIHYLPKKKRVSVFFHGGCFFENADRYPEIDILAYYENLPQKPAAIIGRTFGNGKVILCGSHPEYPNSLCSTEKEASREELFHDLLKGFSYTS